MSWRRALIGAPLLLVACSSSREPRPVAQQSPTTVASSPAVTGQSTSPTSTVTSTTPGAASSTPTSASTTAAVATTSTISTTSPDATTEISGTAVAGTTGGVETGEPPFREANPFAEAVRMRDGTCVGWAGSVGGSTAGLEVGAPVVVLEAERNEEIGRGRIEASRWEDMSSGGGQWNCLFDFTATVTGSPAEFRIRVAALEPWLARPDPTDPDTFVASVSTGVSIGLIPSCPPVPDPEPTGRTARTTTTTRPPRPARFASGWRAIGQYWSRGVASLCRAGLPVTAVARPCRPPGVGSEYITEVVDSADSTVTYADGARVRVGTAVTVVVATGRLCE